MGGKSISTKAAGMGMRRCRTPVGMTIRVAGSMVDRILAREASIMAVDSIAARAEIAGDSKRNAIGCSADPPGLKPAIRWRLYAGVNPPSLRFFQKPKGQASRLPFLLRYWRGPGEDGCAAEMGLSCGSSIWIAFW